jgi:tripartite-type tricarboxylate transporter receptor subunit TctC
VQDLVGGHVSAMFLPISVATPLAQSGQIKLLAVASPQRLKFAPNVPTLAEQGIRGVEVVIWYGMLGPAGMPAETVQRYNTLVNEILRLPDVAEKMAKQGIVTVGGTVDEIKTFMAEDVAKWLKTVRDAGIAPE